MGVYYCSLLCLFLPKLGEPLLFKSVYCVSFFGFLEFLRIWPNPQRELCWISGIGEFLHNALWFSLYKRDDIIYMDSKISTTKKEKGWQVPCCIALFKKDLCLGRPYLVDLFRPKPPRRLGSPRKTLPLRKRPGASGADAVEWFWHPEDVPPESIPLRT